jgi:tRNA A37 threonylcarbamoyladenosine dehydratase
VSAPAGAEGCDVDGNLNCHGYGSSVGVTATFGMVAATRALEFASLATTLPGPHATL